MTLWGALLIALGGFAGGAVNAIAGGGTFFAFPALLAVGVPPVMANASNSVALWPGSMAGAWAYRTELARFKSYLLPMGLASLAGGLAGGLLLLVAGDARFSALIPWLLAFATLLFTFSPQISALMKAWRARRAAPGTSPSDAPRGYWWVQLLVSVYGGFFGAGMGILIMASLAIAGHEDVQEINALKNLLSSIVYSVTVITFVIAGAVSWPHTLVMLVAASLGGYWGARVARSLQGPWLRRVVIGVGAALTLYYFYKQWA
jgi:hypothetical protein